MGNQPCLHNTLNKSGALCPLLLTRWGTLLEHIKMEPPLEALSLGSIPVEVYR